MVDIKYHDFSKSEVGDRVWHLFWGWGTIRLVDCLDVDDMPLFVVFFNGEEEYFTYQGEKFNGDVVLFNIEMKIVPF